MATSSKSRRTDDFYRTLLDAIPSPVLVLGTNVQITDFNASARKLLRSESRLLINRQPGDVLRCLNASMSSHGCGHDPQCQQCMIRNSITQSLTGQKIVRQRARMRFKTGEETTESFFLITTVPFKHNRKRQVLLILEDITELTSLRHILPICASCKKIRDDADYWQEVEGYFQEHLDLDFSHRLCPDCMRKLYPQLSLKKE
jgi:PAS domain-containing protein